MPAGTEVASAAMGTSGNIEFRLEPISSLREIEQLWRELEKRSNDSFFTSWTWVATWLACLPQRIRPLLLAATDRGAIIGVAMAVSRDKARLMRNIRELHFNSTGELELDCITIEHNGFLAAPEAKSALWPVFLRWFAGQKEFDGLVVPGVRQGTIPKCAIDEDLLPHEIVSPAYARTLLHQGGRDEILMRLSSNARQHLRRNLRVLERIGPLVCERADTVETALSWFEALKQLHIRSWTRRGKPHAFRYSFFETFHRALIARGVPEGSVDVLRVSVSGAPLGYVYNFRNGDGAIAYQSGFDDAKRDHRPGYVSHLLAMEAAARNSAGKYDFLAGDNQFKRSFASERYVMSSWRFTRRSLAAKLENAARSLVRNFRARR
ncbi:MAG TPA: GNAT family N-acetyltransferase [Rhizomicrobium sp.]|nr:GNAT family N-acetyltransferase [Rhizomicrobium sp.]